MIKTGLRILCCALLCALLVYAPEIYSAVSTQYPVAQPQRILLRVSLCTQDAAAEKAILSSLQLYMKEFPTIHLRITRPSTDDLFSQPDPQPDLFIFPASLPTPSSTFQHEVADERLCYAVHKESNNVEAANGLLSHLLTTAGLDSRPDSRL